jgi:hypothetical protein
MDDQAIHTDELSSLRHDVRAAIAPYTASGTVLPFTSQELFAIGCIFAAESPALACTVIEACKEAAQIFGVQESSLTHVIRLFATSERCLRGWRQWEVQDIEYFGAGTLDIVLGYDVPLTLSNDQRFLGAPKLDWNENKFTPPLWWARRTKMARLSSDC